MSVIYVFVRRLPTLLVRLMGELFCVPRLSSIALSSPHRLCISERAGSRLFHPQRRSVSDPKSSSAVTESRSPRILGLVTRKCGPRSFIQPAMANFLFTVLSIYFFATSLVLALPRPVVREAPQRPLLDEPSHLARSRGALFDPAPDTVDVWLSPSEHHKSSHGDSVRVWIPLGERIYCRKFVQ